MPVAAGTSERAAAAPITTIRSPPKWIAGDSGVIWRIEPSPKYSMRPSITSGTAGNTKGIAEEASRCAADRSTIRAVRWARRQAWIGSLPS